MSQVLLIYPPSYFSERKRGEGLPKNFNVGKTKFDIWPLGLLSIAASLRQNGISVDVLDAFVCGFSLEEVLNKIDEVKPRIVGISTATMQVRASVQLAQGIKQRFGNSIIVAVGGPHISMDPEFIMKFDCFDLGITGEAENTFIMVVEDILNGKGYERIYHSSLPVNLDELPLPALEKINILDYFPSGEPYFTLATMRGCPFKCIFCSRVAIPDKVRYRTPGRVIEEMQLMIDKYKAKAFVFLDDTFTLNRKYTIELCQEIINRGWKIKWSCNTRANTVDRELLEYMKRAGCEMIIIGVESGDERFRSEVVNKKVKDSDIVSMIKWCKELKIMIACYLMIGFPGETLLEIKKTENFAVKHDLDSMSMHATMVYPGSVLYETMVKEGRKDLRDQWDKYARGEIAIDSLSLVYVPTGLELKDLQKTIKRAYWKFYFRPKIILRQLVRDFSSWDNLKRDAVMVFMLLRFGRITMNLHCLIHKVGRRELIEGSGNHGA